MRVLLSQAMIEIASRVTHRDQLSNSCGSPSWRLVFDNSNDVGEEPPFAIGQHRCDNYLYAIGNNRCVSKRGILK